MCSDFSWIFSVKDYWYATVSAGLGAVLGIWWASNDFKKRERKRNQLCQKNLKIAIAFNLQQASNALETLNTDKTPPNYGFDTVRLSHWIAENQEFFSQDLLREIDWQRCQLEHISSKFIVINNFLVNSYAQKLVLNVNEKEYLKINVDSLHQHLEEVIKALTVISKKIDNPDMISAFDDFA